MRIAYAKEPVLLTFDGELLLAFDAVTLEPRWQTAFEHSLVAVAFASAHAGHPWRSSTRGALVVDELGGLHTVDAETGERLGTRDPVGAPVAVAANGERLAIALADGVKLWLDGVAHDLPLRATALAFSPDGLTLGVAGKDGFREVTVATREVSSSRLLSMAATAVAWRSDGWVVGTRAGTYHVNATEVRRVMNGSALAVACDVRTMAVQTAADSVTVHDWPEHHRHGGTAVTRIQSTGRVITDIVLEGNCLVVAVEGGEVHVVNLGRRRHRATPGRTPRPWTLRVLSEEEARTGKRFGAAALFTLLTLLICVGYLTTSSKQTWVPPPPFLITETCDGHCEHDRVAAVRQSCVESPTFNCVSDADDAVEALAVGRCDDLRDALGRVHDRMGVREDGVHAKLSTEVVAAERGIASGCR